MKLSIIIPVYNEKKTILKIIKKINKIKISKEIIIIDDCSKDGSREIIKKINQKNIKKIFHSKNLGKGAAIISAKKSHFICGDIVIIQDADLEYYPEDYKKLIKPIINEKFKVVYGSRVLNKKRYFSKNFSSIFRIFANHILTIFSNFINNQNLTDAHTCYKVFDKFIFKKISLSEKGFAFCPEITTKLSNKNILIKEIPIRYKGRNFTEGKKIKFSDGLDALFTIIKYKLIK
jgi:glycosyltransferase involved in cell wall biosynthesis